MARLSLLVFAAGAIVDSTIARINPDTLFSDGDFFAPRESEGEMTNFQFKLYWESGYDWKSDPNGLLSSLDLTDGGAEREEQRTNKPWCIQCLNANCAQGSVILGKCDKSNDDQRWRYQGGKLKSVSNTNNCLSYAEPDRLSVRPCLEINDGEQLVTLKSFGSKKLQIRATNQDSKCFTNADDHPSAEDRMCLVSCSKALANDAAYWVQGTFGSNAADDDDDDKGDDDTYDDDEGPHVNDDKDDDDDGFTFHVDEVIGKNNQLKMFWQNGYDWNGCREDKRLCMACGMEDCTSGAVHLEKCKDTRENQRFIGTTDDKIVSKSDQDYCVTRIPDTGVKMRPCSPDGKDKNQRMKIKKYKNGKFQLRCDGKCLSVIKNPVKDEPLRFVACSEAVRFDASFWESGRFEEKCGNIFFNPICFFVQQSSKLRRQIYGEDDDN